MRLLNPLAKMGLVADVVDCIDTINGGRDEAVPKLLAEEIIKSVSGSDPKGMTIYAHSQGGLNTQAALDLASTKIRDQVTKSAMASGMSEGAALAATDKAVLERFKKLDISTFGTIEKGLADGPNYSRYTNEYDPVPHVIREAQRGLVPDQIERDPLGAKPVVPIKSAPSYDPMAAHGMNETYIPFLNSNKATEKVPCC